MGGQATPTNPLCALSREAWVFWLNRPAVVAWPIYLPEIQSSFYGVYHALSD